jgi:hypothetical protein
MASRDLTSLQNVKTYLWPSGTAPSDSDALLQRLVTAMSSAFVSEARDILRQSYAVTLDAQDEKIARTNGAFRANSGFAVNLNGPVIGDPVVTVDGTAVAKRTTLYGTGWALFDLYRLEVFGSSPCSTLTLAYEGGEYLSEPATVPAGSPYTVQASQSDGTFQSDVGVKDASGTAFTKVASAPAVSQYTVNATGLYTFNSANASAALTLSYAYLPAEVEDCVIEMVAYKFRKRERLDQVSANVGGQSVFFNREAWPPTIQTVIDRWSRMFV